MMIIVETCHGASLRVEDTPTTSKQILIKTYCFSTKKSYICGTIIENYVFNKPIL